MVSVDLFPAVALGESPMPVVILEHKVGAIVTKGQAVIPVAHVAGELCSVGPGAVNSLLCVGVAMKGGAVGDYIPVLHVGVIKVTAVGAIPAGTKVACAAAGAVKAAETAAVGDIQKAIGVAQQTFADTDVGLISIGLVV